MTSQSNKKIDKQLFGEGWLDEQLAAVVNELAGRDEQDRPRLTGTRAATMSDPAWLST